MPRMIYIDNAATSWPKPEIVYKTLDAFTRSTAGNPGRSGHRMAVESERLIAETRAGLANLIGAKKPERVAFTMNGTDALNIAIKGGLRKGDHVITTVLEHNSINRPLGRMEKEGFIELSKAAADETGTVTAETIRGLVRENTKMIAVTHCPNVLGVVQPIDEYARIARDAGARLLVDAAQTVGVIEIDVEKQGIDLLAFPGHKALFGLMGTGALYVREGIELGFWREGGVGVASEVELHPEGMPHRLEGGTPNAHGLIALGAGLRFIEETGVRKIFGHEQALALSFIEKLRGDDRFIIYSGKAPDRQIGPVSLNLKGAPPDEVGAIMDQKYGIACRPGLHCAPGTHRHLGTLPAGTVRFSFGFFNTDSDVEAAAGALKEVAGAYSA